jgi:hypothetical protein
MTIEIVSYSNHLENDWNQFNAMAKNGLFIFDRAYLDYHAHRFIDCSMMAYADGKLVALLPAALQGAGSVASHPGLTFGGVILGPDIRGDLAIDVIEAILGALKQRGMVELTVRMLPPYVTSRPAAELDYILWRRGFTLFRRDLSSVVPLPNAHKLNSSKRQALTKAGKADLIVSAGSIEDFHTLLSDVLLRRHATVPVHSIGELRLLSDRFPANILLRTVEHNGSMIAGAVLFRYPTGWHTQYMAVSDGGRTLGALDLVVMESIAEAERDGAAYFSFGVSTVAEGRTLNTGLLWQKEAFGARAVVHDFMRGKL